MTLPAFMRIQRGAVCLAIRLQPRASKNAIDAPLGSELKIKVTAPPVDSAANEALIRLLAEALHCPRGSIQLVRGQTARHKVVQVQGMSPEDVLARLLSSAQER